VTDSSTPARSLRLKLAYDGTAYGGWQRQLNCVSIQGLLETAFQRVTGERVSVTASGRTDAGVHALGQVASCNTNSSLTPDALRRALNASLPSDICILTVQEAPANFHAIREAVQKRYRYQIRTGQNRDVFARHYAWQIWHELDLEKMREATQHLIGRHDFRSFQTSGSQRKTTVRTILDLTLQGERTDFGQRITLEVEADGFLYNMVRNIVGTLVEVGRGKQTPSWVSEVLAARDRRRAGPTAPARGLTLLHVTYPW
jgi:tRNA pseudouridine38-40 synthase